MWYSINAFLYGRGNNYTPEKINHHSNIVDDYFTDIGPATFVKIFPSYSSYK